MSMSALMSKSPSKRMLLLPAVAALGLLGLGLAGGCSKSDTPSDTPASVPAGGAGSPANAAPAAEPPTPPGVPPSPWAPSHS